MLFPVYLGTPGLHVPAHPVFEAAGYFAGARIYFRMRNHATESDPLPLDMSLWLLVGCVLGAWIGSRLLAWAELPDLYLPLAQTDPARLLGGKTLVGGLLGGWAGVELAKKQLGIRRSTGDLFVWPLAVGTAIGRVGCFLTGLSDHTYGLATTLPWGIDFGDGVPRHPTQIYESIFVLALAASVHLCARPNWPAGSRFRLYLSGYLVFRLAIEFIKPREIQLAGLSAIQLASLFGATLAVLGLMRLAHRAHRENRVAV